VDLDLLPPWDQIPYFQAVQWSQAATTGGLGTQQVLLCSADPLRVLIVISQLVATTPILVSPDPLSLVSGVGIYVGGTPGILVIDQRTWGPLAASAWYANLAGTTKLNVFTYRMKEWPGWRTRDSEKTAESG
jgi:hypothetical protein